MVIDKKHYVALTGCSGSGKSTALRFIREERFFVADFDKFSLKVITENSQVQRKLESIIDEQIFTGGQIDLKKIGAFFESDRIAEKYFEEWYQPILGQEIRKFLATVNHKIIFADVPFLAQKKISTLFDEIWIIEATFENCVRRIKARNNYDFDKIKYLIERSPVSDEIYNSADKIIDNNDGLDEFRDKIKYILN